MRKVLIKSGSSIAGILIAIPVAVLIWQYPAVFGEYPLVVRALLFNVMVESKMKRLCGVKDSGNVLPGHGGILDRLDSFLLATPFFYYWMLLIA